MKGKINCDAMRKLMNSVLYSVAIAKQKIKKGIPIIAMYQTTNLAISMMVEITVLIGASDLEA